MDHPYEPHADDLVAVSVVWPQGVREDGRLSKSGQTLTVARGHAEAQNRPGRQVYRILSTVHYANGPADQAEGAVREGPLEIEKPD